MEEKLKQLINDLNSLDRYCMYSDSAELPELQKRGDHKLFDEIYEDEQHWIKADDLQKVTVAFAGVLLNYLSEKEAEEKLMDAVQRGKLILEAFKAEREVKKAEQ